MCGGYIPLPTTLYNITLLTQQKEKEKRKMKVLVFAKKRQTKEGKAFTAYVTRMTKKDGTDLTAGVKFREECGSPKADECPCYIEVEKKNANMSTKKFDSVDPETSEVREVTNYTLWVSDWKMSADKYVDHSLDEFDD